MTAADGRPAGAVAARVERLLVAPPEAVFRAWTNAQTLALWMSPLGRAEVEADVRVGGALHVTMIDGDVRIDHTAEFVELDPPRRLAFTWRSAFTGSDPSIVTVELTPRGRGTWLVLTHDRLPGDVVESHEGGWRAMVERLAGLIDAADGKEFELG